MTWDVPEEVEKVEAATKWATTVAFLRHVISLSLGCMHDVLSCRRNLRIDEYAYENLGNNFEDTAWVRALLL